MQNSIIHMPLDLTRTQHQWQIECIRGNTAREIHLRLHTKGVPFIITSDVRALMIITKPDNTTVINDCVLKVGESEVIYELSSQAVSATGLCSCQLHLTNGVKTIATPVFNMYVSTRNLSYSGTVSMDDLDSLVNAIAQAENLDCKIEGGMLVITDRLGNKTTAAIGGTRTPAQDAGFVSGGFEGYHVVYYTDGRGATIEEDISSVADDAYSIVGYFDFSDKEKYVTGNAFTVECEFDRKIGNYNITHIGAIGIKMPDGNVYYAFQDTRLISRNVRLEYHKFLYVDGMAKYYVTISIDYDGTWKYMRLMYEYNRNESGHEKITAIIPFGGSKSEINNLINESLQNVTGGGTGLSEADVHAMIGQIVSVGSEPITNLTEIIIEDESKELEIPTSSEFNSLSARVTILEGRPSGGGGTGAGTGGVTAYATLEMFGGVAGDTSATARAANTKAVTDAILAGYNIKCEGGITAEGHKTYSFSGVVDVRAIKYRSIDIDLNGCRFSDFHIIANVVDDSAMTATSCSWAWTNGNKFYLAIHDGLIGASTSSDEMTSLPKQPVAITGLIPRFYNLQAIGKVHLCAMPPIYCDQMYFENIKLIGSADSVWDYWNDLDNICVITGKDSNGYIYKNNGDGCRLNGDQFRFTEINDGRHFFTLYENLGTIVSDCISCSFGVNNSMVKFVNCHNESGTRRTPVIHSIVRGGYTDVVLDHCYIEQHAFEVFAGMSATVLGCVSMIDCEFRTGVLAVAGHSDPHACNFLEALYKMKYQRGNKIASMDRYILPRTKVPSDVFCVASVAPNISTNTSLTKVATGVYDANFKTGTYSYTVAYHNACALQSAIKTETKSVTISSQATLNRFAIENYGGQMISLYKSDGSNTYRAIIPSYPTTGTFTLMIDDCGAFVSLWNYTTRTIADSSFARETMKDAALWELVTSKPTISVNANIRSCGSMIYDTSGKLYSTNGNSLTAIN